MNYHGKFQGKILQIIDFIKCLVSYHFFGPRCIFIFSSFIPSITTKKFCPNSLHHITQNKLNVPADRIGSCIEMNVLKVVQHRCAEGLDSNGMCKYCSYCIQDDGMDKNTLSFPFVVPSFLLDMNEWDIICQEDLDMRNKARIPSIN